MRLSIQSRLIAAVVPLAAAILIVVGAAWLSAPPSPVAADAVRRIDLLLLGSALLLILALAVIVAAGRQLTYPVRALVAAAVDLERGRLDRRIGALPAGELHDLGESIDRMAAALEAKVAAISDERARLQAIVSSMVEGVLVLDRDGRIVLLNAAAEQMLGLAPAVVGQRLLEVLRHHALNELVYWVLASSAGRSEEIAIGVSRAGASNGPAGLGSAAGEARIFQVQASVARATVLGAVLVFHDITEIRRLERVRKDFVANVSHELRTPLTSIAGYIEALLDGAKDDSRQCAEFLQIIKRHAAGLNAIVADLLQLSSIESGQYRWRREAVRISDLVEAAVRVVAPAAAGKRQFVTAGAVATELEVYGDSGKLGEVLINLLDNAVKYTPAGGRIGIEVEPGAETVEIRVSDSGIGIPPADQARIFERFFRVDRARSRELGGTGLGLAIVKHIVEAHAGRVAVESVPGKGSRFTVTLQRAKA